MKNLLKKSLCLVLAAGLTTSLMACTIGKKAEQEEIGETVDVYARQNPDAKENVSDSDKIFISNGASDYSIVIPEGTRSKTHVEGYAAGELQYFINDAVGITLPIIYDTGIEYSETDKYISIGNTAIFNGSAMKNELDKSVLKNDGFHLNTYGSLVVMNACGENGLLYSVYGFLERVMDYEYFAEDCWTISHEDVIKLKNLDVIDVPDFNQRQINTGASNDPVYCLRMRQHGQQGQKLSVGESGGWELSDMSICQQVIPYKTYQSTHPSWYYGDGGPYSGQPCLTAIMNNYVGDEVTEIDPADGKKYLKSPSTGRKMLADEYVGEDYDVVNGNGALDTFMRNIINNYIVKTPKVRIYMLGANDNVIPCGCDRCKAEYEEYYSGGQYCVFANVVSEKFEEWQDNLTPTDEFYSMKSRYVEFAFFAYLFAEKPPVSYDEATGTYTPLSDKVICRENVVVRIAPIYSVNMFLHNDKQHNPGAAVAFAGWGAVSNKLAVWDYGCSFRDAIVPYPDWGTIKANFMLYREYGVQEIFTQLQSRTSGYSLRAYKVYVRAQLMWNADQDFYELTEKFFMNYYGEKAGKIMLEYLNYLELVIQSFCADGREDGYIYTQKLSSPQFFDYKITNKLGTFFDDAIASIQDLQVSDPDLYLTYYNRIKCESLYYIYLMLANYTGYLTNEKIVQLCDDFEYYRQMAGLLLRAISSNDTSFNGWAEGIKKNYI